eukprot:2373611-Rhodomonas_salina.1
MALGGRDGQFHLMLAPRSCTADVHDCGGMTYVSPRHCIAHARGQTRGATCWMKAPSTTIRHPIPNRMLDSLFVLSTREARSGIVPVPCPGTN